ncbi:MULTISPECIES: helix-turn-helix domain-containing protein [Streptomyces]|uniref:helix-turn-helix domain-containing protein n=1 Tax=Streptomyces TaxID=1883 RepID=UPI0002E6B064|nr:MULTISPECIES: helix-turn-helix domain-containing protein [Streptomyces]
MSENELGRFLRTRREAVTPADAGLPTGPRRRTPGLRRSELAMLAGVSVEYVTRLEQGRDRRPSASVLSALAEALGLSMRERIHLHRLTKAAEPGFSCGAESVPPGRTVRAPVRALLDRLEPAAAVVQNRLGELLATTRGFDRLMGPVGMLDGEPASIVRYVFGDERARVAFPDWERFADDQVAALKDGPFRADPHLARLADELTVTAGSRFTAREASVSGPPRPAGVLRMVHPGLDGELRLAYETLELPADDDQRLLVYLPADEGTAARLAALSAAGERLRAV